jgi:hypothetical protein
VAVDARRVLLIVVALSAGGAGLLAGWLLPRDDAHAIEERRPASPVFDAADMDVRLALVWQDGPPRTPPAPASELFLRCNDGLPDEYRIAQTPGYTLDPRARTLAVTRQGDGALLQYSERQWLAPPEEEQAYFASIAIDAERFRAIEAKFAAAGYPQAMAPWDGPPCPDAGTRRIESCLGGRYYTVFRGCVTPGDLLAIDVLALARDQFAAAGKPLPSTGP